MTLIYFGTLPCRKRNLTTARVSIFVEIARVPDMLPRLFPSGRAKDPGTNIPENETASIFTVQYEGITNFGTVSSLEIMAVILGNGDTRLPF